jgi:uncharacterized protein (UPF0248 family)
MFMYEAEDMTKLVGRDVGIILHRILRIVSEAQCMAIKTRIPLHRSVAKCSLSAL